MSELPPTDSARTREPINGPDDPRLPAPTSPPPGDIDPLPLDPALLTRYHAKLLDPTTALQLPGQPELRSTVYVSDQILVSVDPADDALVAAALVKAAGGQGLIVVPDPRHDRKLALSRVLGGPVVLAYSLQPDPNRAVAAQPPPDAWSVLQNLRADPTLGKATALVGLNHLVLADTGSGIGGTPYKTPSGKAVDGSASYGNPGSGGRTPVTWVGPAPAQTELAGRRPRVAILDTGTAAHAWFDSAAALTFVDPLVARVQLPSSPPDGNATGMLDDPLQGTLDDDAGHGTFIAGLIRQTCPNAVMISIRIMGSDGVVLENALIDALELLLAAQLAAQKPGGDPAGIVDVVSLSLGYYHEFPEELNIDHLLWPVIDGLSRAGVTVVASAGNDSTTRPLYPAAFTPYPGGVNPSCPVTSIPVVSVGARNPNDTIALFSNAGPWVCTAEYGASVVSTMPRFDGGAQPGYRVEGLDGTRESIDPDDFLGGFATWSGTSFSAPILAGRLAQALLDTGELDAVDPLSAISRARTALTSLTSMVLT